MLLLLACTASTNHSDEIPAEIAVFQPTCGPADGIALELLIGVETPGCGEAFTVAFTGEHYRLDFWESAYPPSATSYSFDQSRGDGTGLWSEDTTETVSITLVHGQVEISSQKDGIYRGTYVVQQEDEATRQGHFEAGTCDASPICG